MRTLGENVSALRAGNRWTLSELANRVRRAGAPKVQHQHLQQLESKPHTHPRYIVELAAAFGKTVEDLHDWEPGMPMYGPNSAHSHQPRVADTREGYVVAQSGSPSADESELLSAYRSCPPSVREALHTLARAGARRKS